MLCDTSVYQTIFSPSPLFLLWTVVTNSYYSWTNSARPPTSLECALLLPSTWCRASSYNPKHGALTAGQKRFPKQSVLQLHSFFPLCRKLSCIWGCNLASSFCFSEQLQSIYSSLTVHVSLILDETFHSPLDILQPLHVFLDLGTQNCMQASSYVLLFFISFPSRQILGHMKKLFFIIWYLKHGSLALRTYTLADIHVNVHLYSCTFSIGKKLLLLSLVLLWNKHPAHLFSACSLTSLLNGFK